MWPLGGCITIFRHVEVEEIAPPSSDLPIETPLKAHLHDGRVVVFEEGAVYRHGARDLWGAGTVYNLDLSSATIPSVSLDSIAAIETFRTEVSALGSFVGSVAATALGVFATTAAAVAIFGSCPTVYANDTLQAEAFSHSVSRLMESRDVDRLQVEPDDSGRIRLELRNEALETHYINHLELLHATHNHDEMAVSTGEGRALVIGELRHPSIKDRVGNDKSEQLRHADQEYYRTDDAVLDGSSSDDLMDFLIVEVPRPHSESAVLFIRGRSSLLTSVLLYEFMLSQGPRTLDYVGVDLESIAEAMALGSLFREHLGVRVSVERDGRWEPVGRLGMSGPVASESKALKIAVPDVDVLRLKLDFLADSWRFDQILIGENVRYADMKRIPLSNVEGYADSLNDVALSALSEADTDYHMTLPGQSFETTFEASEDTREGLSGTYFLAAQGYYTEWIRRDWFDRASSRFEINDNTLVSLLRVWSQKRSWYEKYFFDRRVPLASSNE